MLKLSVYILPQFFENLTGKIKRQARGELAKENKNSYNNLKVEKMEKSQKQDTQSKEKTLAQTEQDEIWITFGDNGKIRSAPLSVFKKIAKERGWEPKSTDWNTKRFKKQ